MIQVFWTRVPQSTNFIPKDEGDDLKETHRDHSQPTSIREFYARLHHGLLDPLEQKRIEQLRVWSDRVRTWNGHLLLMYFYYENCLKNHHDSGKEHYENLGRFMSEMGDQMGPFYTVSRDPACNHGRPQLHWNPKFVEISKNQRNRSLISDDTCTETANDRTPLTEWKNRQWNLSHHGPYTVLAVYHSRTEQTEPAFEPCLGVDVMLAWECPDMEPSTSNTRQPRYTPFAMWSYFQTMYPVMTDREWSFIMGSVDEDGEAGRTTFVFPTEAPNWTCECVREALMRFHLLWAVKESYLKAMSIGLGTLGSNVSAIPGQMKEHEENTGTIKSLRDLEVHGLIQWTKILQNENLRCRPDDASSDDGSTWCRRGGVRVPSNGSGLWLTVHNQRIKQAKVYILIGNYDLHDKPEDMNAEEGPWIVAVTVIDPLLKDPFHDAENAQEARNSSEQTDKSFSHNIASPQSKLDILNVDALQCLTSLTTGIALPSSPKLSALEGLFN